MSTDNLEKEIEKLNSDIEFKNKRIDKLEIELAKNKSVLRTKDEKITKQTQKLEEQGNSLEEKEQKIRDLTEKIENLAVDQLENELNNLKNLTESQKNKIDEFKNQNDTLKEDLANTKENMKGLNDTIDNQKEEIENLKDQTVQMKNKLEEKEKELVKLNVNNTKLEESINNLKGTLSSSSQEKIEISNQIKDLEGKIKDLESAVEEKGKELEKTKQELKFSTEISENQKEMTEDYKKQIVDLNQKLTDYINQIEEKDEKIKNQQEELDKVQAGVDLYEVKIKELKDTVIEKEEEISKLKSEGKKPSKSAHEIEELNRKIKLLETELKETKQGLKKQKSGAEVVSSDEKESTAIDNLALDVDKLESVDMEQIKKQFRKQQSIIKDFSSLNEKQRSQIEKIENKLEKRNTEIEDFKSKIKDLEKQNKKLTKDLKKNKYVIKELKSEVDLEGAIDEVDKVGEYESAYEEINRLKEIINKSNATIDTQKEQIKKFENTIELLRKDSNVQTAQKLRESYEQYIMDLQKEAYDSKYQFETAQNKIKDLEFQLERYNKLFSQYEEKLETIGVGETDYTQVTPTQDTVSQEEIPPEYPESTVEEQYDGENVFVPSESNLKPSMLFGNQSSEEDQVVQQKPAQNIDNNGLLGSEDHIESEKTPLSSPPASSSTDNLLSSEDLSGDESSSGALLGEGEEGGLLTGTTEVKLLPEEGKFTLLNKIINQFINSSQKIQDTALCMFDGLVLSQTFDWDISSDISRVINEWKEEATSIFLKGTKYATLKASEDALVATSTKGRGHLLCVPINSDLFLIFVLEKTADPLFMFDDFEPYQEQLRNLL